MTTNKTLISLSTLTRKETRRFLRIWTQTLVPPVITQSLYFVVFGGFVGRQVAAINGVSYMAFLVPGLVMMAIITSAFTNTVSSFFFTKWQRNIDEILVSPTPNWVIVAGFGMGGILRGILVGLIVFLISIFFTHPQIAHLGLVLIFMVLTAITFSFGGLLNGIFAKKIDDVGIFPTFVLTPLTYLGGVFYPISALPGVWQVVSKFNPIVYMIDGFRYGFYGFSSVPVLVSLGILIAFSLALGILCVVLLNKGKGIRT
ncbi:MAG: ABC transporter permease [Patescibacteria group bacterium]